jgi:SAM-dependent methyltransferase
MRANSQCRFCGGDLEHTFVDLGMSPLCESYVSADQLNRMERFYPLHVFVCAKCFLVQLDEYVDAAEIFTEYAYFSSYSETWLKHSEDYVKMAVLRFGLNLNSHVVELASNDGYLLQYLLARGIPCLGVEPALNVAAVAVEKGVPTLAEFFGVEVARRLVSGGKSADLVIGNNVLAQVPDLNDFVAGMKILLKPGGVVTVEFPHLLRLMEANQFDTIYHEHFSYFALYSVEEIFAAHGLTVFDVEELSTHGGSLRIFACHDNDDSFAVTGRVREMRMMEGAFGITSLEKYDEFAERVKETKCKILEFLISARRENKHVAGYGAPGKGNTLLNYCGIRTDLIDFTVDRNPYKQAKFLPGTRIPIFAPEKIREAKPDYVFILPWNFKEEIMQQNAFIREWGGKFVTPIPELRVYS